MNRSNSIPDLAHVTAQQLLGRSLNNVEEKNAPPRLFVVGDVTLLRDAPKVSLVGSRKASSEALATARALSSLLVEHGVVVVSGLAEGVDTAAHEAAIEFGGRTIGVLGPILFT